MARKKAKKKANMKDKIRKILKEYFHWDEDEENEDSLLFSTRDDGDVGAGVPGRHDIQQGREIVQKLSELAGVTAALEAIDEWVMVRARWSELPCHLT